MGSHLDAGVIMEIFRLETAAMLLAAASFPTIALAQGPASENEGERRTARQGDIIVTGRSLATEEVASPLPVQILAGDELAHRRQGGLGETLVGMPGIHLDNFGGGASRPVIRGQTLPRIFSAGQRRSAMAATRPMARST